MRFQSFQCRSGLGDVRDGIQHALLLIVAMSGMMLACRALAAEGQHFDLHRAQRVEVDGLDRVEALEGLLGDGEVAIAQDRIRCRGSCRRWPLGARAIAAPLQPLGQRLARIVGEKHFQPVPRRRNRNRS
jgi:hypothetical protein